MDIFSKELQRKVNSFKNSPLRQKIQLGNISFSSPLLLAPMSSICVAPFRLLMEELGAGGTVSELISCHGINYGNEKTIKMLKLDPREQNVGLQLFGEDAESMALAAKKAQEFEPKFIDINMGCPVRKVVTKGGGSALLRDTSKLGGFFSKIKSALEIPLTIKIRTGWDIDDLNADEVIHIARNEGIEFVAIHGRTRTQQYKGNADWGYLEKIAEESPLPVIGNGDLNYPGATHERLLTTKCHALMLGRGPLRNPFLFLEALDPENPNKFTPADYWEVIQRLYTLNEKYVFNDKIYLVQMRKHIIWMSSGFGKASTFRDMLFKTSDLSEVMRITEDYFLSLGNAAKKIDYTKSFMAGGHG